MNAEILTTERLVLTPVAVSDLDSLIALWSDEEFTRHITGRAMTSEEVWFRLLRDLGQWNVAGYGSWTVRLATDGAYLGNVSILDHRRLIDPPLTEPELGWGLSPAFQGRGFALEAVQAVLGWADVRLAAVRTVCMIAPENLASIRLAERVGYSPYATTTYKDSAVQLFERPKKA
ncbi:GNAT family N-acetyltransferase [Brevundimonas sp. SL130]|uniref:GNAT family N-acetyltransferase n=1 Tax=Brevundimonas sp. SL130 TaxID=2995143 RepID=UPI00226C92DE|nr:GNAT family N-acetyltransferase [Brevundimonas sp. SL130]WAC60727.1 GNAT family N-acetyltransferase [Brevundimonas sp. SL130]